MPRRPGRHSLKHLNAAQRLAEDKIARAEEQAAAEVKSVAVDVAVAAAEKLMRDKVSGAKGSDLISAGISELKSRLN